MYLGDHLLGEPVWRIHELFNLDSEASIPTWFSIIQLYMIGLIAIITASSRPPAPLPPSKGGLMLFGLGFMYLSMDEGASIHEKITYEFYNNPLVPYFHGTHGIWIVVYGVIGIIALLILFKDIVAIFKAFPKIAWIFVVGMIVYLAGSAGAETITFFYIDKSDPLVYTVEVMLEEFMEMSGASLLLYGMALIATQKLVAQRPV